MDHKYHLKRASPEEMRERSDCSLLFLRGRRSLSATGLLGRGSLTATTQGNILNTPWEGPGELTLLAIGGGTDA